MTPEWEASADLVVVGSGVAGLTAALRAREAGLRVVVVTKSAISDGNTRWAQGGIAVVLPGGHESGDSAQRHAADTIAALTISVVAPAVTAEPGKAPIIAPYRPSALVTVPPLEICSVPVPDSPI